ncbi:hypothetical protein RB653_001994 [Dictyostelium firmibasis]|uniref:Uncharacterized protein n=1 Tax=Dictyostelium firmibasis TaxID=79012 RepID=A0AAN7YVA3_9MYCE
MIILIMIHYQNMGLPHNLIEEIISRCENAVERFKCSLDSELKILLVLFFLKKGPKNSNYFERVFKIGGSEYKSSIYSTPNSIDPYLGNGENILPNNERKISQSRFHTALASRRNQVENGFAKINMVLFTQEV